MVQKLVSNSVINRMPRYYRYLKMLLNKGITRISSKELANQMKVTASQIRQDLNCFGGFGQQGYGYNVELLYNNIGSILGLSANVPAILIGSGSRGQSLTREEGFFETKGFNLIAAFDKAPNRVGMKLVNGLVVKDISELTAFCLEKKPKMAVVCIPRAEAEAMADSLVQLGIKAFWNFSGFDFQNRFEDVEVVNVHLGDSLMTLSYKVSHPSFDNE